MEGRLIEYLFSSYPVERIRLAKIRGKLIAIIENP
jgi:hypothetical protein